MEADSFLSCESNGNLTHTDIFNFQLSIFNCQAPGS